MNDKKLGVIIPYRNRFDHLNEFVYQIRKYLTRKKIKHEIFVIHQDDAKLFNRGMLLNIGYIYAKKSKCDYLVFHDVDMIPFRVDYSYTDIPIHLSCRFKDIQKEIFDEYFGGVTLFPIETFEKINGYSNKYWGWGYEDTDLLYRCIKNNIELDTIKIKNQHSNKKKLKFNGTNSYVRGLNTIDFEKPITIHISFKPNELTCNYKQYTDDYNIFTIPGYDFSISYNSYSRYNVCLFNKNKEAIFINSKITKDYYTNITITIDVINQEIKVYQDGKILETILDFGELYEYSKQKYFYLGIGNPYSITDKKYFKGLFDKFFVYDGILNDNDVSKLANNQTDEIENKKIIFYSTNNIKYYKLLDLSGNGNHGDIYNCEIVKEEIDEFIEVKIPHRRDCIFTCLPHEENGFVNNTWKDQSIRWNQLRFYNEVCKNDDLLYNEGLSTLEFIEHAVIQFDNIKEIKVGI